MVYEVGNSDVPLILFHLLGAPTLLEEPDVVAVWQPDKMWYEVPVRCECGDPDNCKFASAEEHA